MISGLAWASQSLLLIQHYGSLYILLVAYAYNLSAIPKFFCRALLNSWPVKRTSFSFQMKLYSEGWARQTKAPISTVSSAFSTCKFTSKNLPLSLSLQDVQISWVSLWVSSSSRTPKKLKAKPTLDPLSFTWLLPERTTQCSFKTWPKFACNSTEIQFIIAERFANLRKMGCEPNMTLGI